MPPITEGNAQRYNFLKAVFTYSNENGIKYLNRRRRLLPVR